MASDTKQRILDVSEQLFADFGFAGTSLRKIIAAAGVNLAAVHYHFHSKEALLEAVLVRRLEPLNRERLARLQACEQQAGGKGPTPEGILEAFIGPPMRLILNPSGEGRLFGKLVGRLHSETGAFFAATARKHFLPVFQRFSSALRRALPEVPVDELHWRMHYAVGVMAHTLTSWDRLGSMFGGVLNPLDIDAAVPRLVNFLAAGFRAPVVSGRMARRRAPRSRREKRA